MFEAYKIAIDVSVTDGMSAPLTSMAALMAKAESKTGSLQERLQKVSAVLKSGAGLLDAGANLANSFGKAIDQAAALKDQLAGIGSASGDAAVAMDGMQHSAARVPAPKRKAGLGQLVAGGGTDLAAALGLPAQEPVPKARKRAPAVRKTAAAGTTRTRAKPKAKEAAALDQLGAYGQVEKVAAKTTRRTAATHKGRGKEDAGAQVLHQLMNLGGPNSAAALIKGARGQVDALANQQMQAARASVNGALDQIGHSLSSAAQKMLNAGIRQASDFVSQHQQAFQHVAEGVVIVQRAMEFTDQVRALATTFQDVRSAFGVLGGPAMQPVHATLERLGGGLGRFKLKDLSALGKAMDVVRDGFGSLGTKVVPGLAKAMPGVTQWMTLFGSTFDKLGPAVFGGVGKVRTFGTSLANAVSAAIKGLVGSGGGSGLTDNLLSFGDALKVVKIGMAVALAWEVGQLIGNIINRFLPQNIKDKFGEWAVAGAAALGNTEAKRLQESNRAIEAQGGWVPGGSKDKDDSTEHATVNASKARPASIETVAKSQHTAIIEVHSHHHLDGRKVAHSVVKHVCGHGQHVSSTGSHYDHGRLVVGKDMTGV